MTGYSKVAEVSEDIEITVEVKTLNAKHLSVAFSLPAILSKCEIPFTELVSKYVRRGKVSVRIHMRFLSPPSGVEIEAGLARAYYEALDRLASDLGIPEPVKLENVLRFKEILRFEPPDDEVERYCFAVGKVLEKALGKVVEERKREGERLRGFLEGFLKDMSVKIERIEKISERIPKIYAKALKENVRKIVPDDVLVNEDVLETAIAVLAERADIREEIDRLKSHVSRALDLIGSDESVGPALDFLAQEMLREFNTILSKSKDVEISNLAIDGKILVNSFREQVQNVE